MKPAELVALAKQRLGAATEYELEKKTGVSRANLSHYKHNTRYPTNTHAKLLADAAGLPWAEVIAELEIERASDESTKTTWGKALASMRAKAVALVLAMVCALSALTAPVQGPVRALLRRRLTII